MRKFLIATLASVSALVVAAPAAAQYYPAPQPYGYGQGYGYGYNNNQHAVGYLVQRVDRVRNHIDRLDSRDRISEREARSLRNEAQSLRNRVLRSGYNGLSGREHQNLNVRLARLEQRVRYEARDGDNRRDGWRNGWVDRDRDGRDDRYENDRGRYPG
jgi:hypothetical protein